VRTGQTTARARVGRECWRKLLGVRQEHPACTPRASVSPRTPALSRRRPGCACALLRGLICSSFVPDVRPPRGRGCQQGVLRPSHGLPQALPAVAVGHRARRGESARMQSHVHSVPHAACTVATVLVVCARSCTGARAATTRRICDCDRFFSIVCDAISRPLRFRSPSRFAHRHRMAQLRPTSSLAAGRHARSAHLLFTPADPLHNALHVPAHTEAHAPGFRAFIVASGLGDAACLCACSCVCARMKTSTRAVAEPIPAFHFFLACRPSITCTCPLSIRPSTRNPQVIQTAHLNGRSLTRNPEQP